jgi:hypothetical protein
MMFTTFGGMRYCPVCGHLSCVMPYPPCRCEVLSDEPEDPPFPRNCYPLPSGDTTVK